MTEKRGGHQDNYSIDQDAKDKSKLISRDKKSKESNDLFQM